MSGIRSYVSGMSLVLLLASLLLGGLFYLQWGDEVSPHGVAAANTVEQVDMASKLEQIPPFVPLPIRSFSEITLRPLFTEGRTPPEKPAESVTNQAPITPLRLKLEGVAITPESKVAVITDLQTRELLRLSQGMSHGNWKVTAVSKDSVTIQQGVREMTLKLEIEAAPGGARKPPFKIPIRPPARR